MGKLAQNIARLIREHPRRRPDGAIVAEPALLDQLAESVKPSGSSSFSAASAGSGCPASLAAIMRWQKLDTYAREVQQDRGRSMRGTLGSIVASWETPGSDEDEAFLIEATDWVIEQVLELTSPPVKRRPIWADCPACDARTAPNADGEIESALSARDRDPETGQVLSEDEMSIACAQCGAEWRNDGDNRALTWLLHYLRR